jgi:hypothetical protein
VATIPRWPALFQAGSAPATCSGYNPGMVGRGTIVALAIVGLLEACGGKTERDFASTGTGEPTGSGGSAGSEMLDASAGGGAGVIPATGGMVNTGGSANAGAGGSTASSGTGGSSGIDWSLIEWEAVGGSAPVEPDCDALAVFAGGQRIADDPARQALFSDSLDRVVLRVEGAVLVVSLPSGEATELAVPDVNSIEWVGQGQQQVLATLNSRDLLLIPLDGGPSTVLASSVCSHAAAPDGSRVYVARDCVFDPGSPEHGSSSLDVIELATRRTQHLADRVFPFPQAWSGVPVAISPDSEWAAFLVDAQVGGNAPIPNTVRLVNRLHTEQRVISQGQSDQLTFFPNGLLLLARFGGIYNPGARGDTLLVYAPAQDALTEVVDGAGYYFQPTYEVSSAGRLALGAQCPPYDPPDSDSCQLYSISLVDGSAQLLTDDLFPFPQSADGGHRPYAVTADGGHAVYLNSQYDQLHGVPASGGTPILLANDTSGYDYVLSESDADDVAAVEWPEHWHEGPSRLRVGSVSTGTSTVVHESEDEIVAVRFTSDGRGVTFVERGQPSRLAFASRSGQQVEILAEWGLGLLDETYVTDASSCVALYSTEEPETATHLALIPQDTP